MNDPLGGQSLRERMLALEQVYADIEASQSAFRTSAAARSASLACPPGCSACCKGFVPDVLPVEADRVALFLLAEREDLLGRFLSMKESSANPSGTCVFWNPLGPGGGCSIYPARALICRFFGFSAMKNKEGEPAFTLCRWMPSPPGLDSRILVGQALLE